MAARLLLVSSMYPGPTDPDHGVFVQDLAEELERLGWTIERAVVSRRGGSPLKHAGLLARAAARARSFRPDVVYGHFLVPGGTAAAVAARIARARLVLNAHGKDVRNIDEVPGVRALTRLTVNRADAMLVLSDFMREELRRRLPDPDCQIHVIPYGVDLDRFRGRDPVASRAALGWDGEPPFFLCVGGLAERKNVVRLAEAFERLGTGTLAFVGDGELRPRLEGRPRVRVVGRVRHERIADWLAACDVLCQPALVEPFGQSLLEAMASERTVVATRVGGPPEFVTPDAGVLVDPQRVEAIEAGLRAAAAFPTPNPAARAAAARFDLRRQARLISAVLDPDSNGARP